MQRARAGDPRAVARLITLVESGDPALPQIAAALGSDAVKAVVIGITGSPGVGKSTTTNELVRAFRKIGRRVGVLAVDPSSPFTGGAILGDRVRMQDHAIDPGVYIRSMSSRGHLGGLAAATPAAVRVLAGAGCDVVLVETVGVGQAEVEIASLADTTLVLLAPGMGDAIQAVKAGILEIADIFVVNKADRDGADATYRDIQGMIALGGGISGTAQETGDNGGRLPGDWRPKVLKASAAKAEGIDAIVEALEEHRAWLERTGELTRRRRQRAAAEIEALALGELRAKFAELPGEGLQALAAEVADGRLDPYAASTRLLDGIL
ncbi:transporter [Rhizocola hellebori]|uniref:Transporter n=1 Tax=Rhizocola hellebori TaxID=1392758 RepID=A0A8J3Q7R7_9ACTN|nr:transporter [Rhizocola hellebori]